ncbi:hypothetical protein CKM354_000642100 [Cercospora kikuchii]|uniref:Uncharacterized protein n=1 Tax=Cercospora kikuchii TaxID=84275 RepID=A0A9P3CRM8_9PEZI|nr:uncharacterized protein CKM354_000642100 [Cercospora kikuchii]GIZ43183.1 hypothetical protein CKM354_000642100 [Cercospora kikuchii]
MAFSRFFTSANRTSHHDRIHWRAPALMIGFLTIGAAFAIGHHAFYNSLHGTEVRSTPFQLAGWEITPQQLNTAGGTAFAFAVKASLVLAISTAYVQLFFRAIAKVGYHFACIDSWFSGLGDITALFGITTFWTHPLLAVVAVTAWLLPLVAVITPATLSVNFDRLPPVNESYFVPAPAFASLKIADVREWWGDGDFMYWRAATEATRTINAVAAAGSILPIAPPAVNSSWLVTMPAPRLACDHVNETLRDAIKDNIASVLGPFLYQDQQLAGGNFLTPFRDNMFNYMSWFASSDPRRGPGVSSEMPFFTPSPWSEEDDRQPNASERTAAALANGFNLFHNYSRERLYVASLPTLMDDETPLSESLKAMFEGPNMTTATRTRKAMDWAFENATVLQCELLASEYTLRFSYTGSSQEQVIEIMQLADVEMNLDEDYLRIAHTAVVEPGCLALIDGFPFPDDPKPSGCYIDTESLLRFSYVGIMEGFASFTVGAANLAGRNDAEGYAEIRKAGQDRNDNSSAAYSFTSRVLGTSLGDTLELEPLNRALMSAQGLLRNESAPRALNEAYSLLRPTVPSDTRKHLKDALEELFFNITMSMASSPMLTYNITAPNAPDNVTVTINSMGNIYSYSAEKLWLAYGLAIGVTIINVGFGLLAIFRTGASFTLNFSTIVRAAKNAGISIETDEQEHPGKDPLPEQWKRATFEIRPHVVYEIRSLKSGAYTSVNPIAGERDNRS